MCTKNLGKKLNLAVLIPLFACVSPTVVAKPDCPGHPSCKYGGSGDNSQQLASASCELLPDPRAGKPPGIYTDGYAAYVNLKQGVQCTVSNNKGLHRLATDEEEIRLAYVSLDVDKDCGEFDLSHPDAAWEFDGLARITTQGALFPQHNSSPRNRKQL
jgi:hypothetical protein